MPKIAKHVYRAPPRGGPSPRAVDVLSIPLSAPDISEDDIAAVTGVLRTPFLSLGPRVPHFEEDIARYVGVRHAVAVNSGTSALHLAVRSLGIGEGDEVITTPFSFVASSNCILFERAMPVFADILPDTLCIDPAKVEAAITTQTKAIIAVDVFGCLCDYAALRRIAQQHHCALIEDSCEALGSQRGARMAGSFGDCGMFAFYPNKQMTTGEGGVLVTDRDDIARLARSMRNQGRGEGDTWLLHERLGYNYRLSDINCALGSSQLRRLENFIHRRTQVMSWYREALAPFADMVTVPVEQSGVRVSWFVCVVRLADRFQKEDRDRILLFLRERGIGCGNYFPPIHLQPFYRAQYGYRPGMFPVTEGVAARTLALPFHPNLVQEDVVMVVSALRDALFSVL